MTKNKKLKVKYYQQLDELKVHFGHIPFLKKCRYIYIYA